jgi:hypothetical protein
LWFVFDDTNITILFFVFIHIFYCNVSPLAKVLSFLPDLCSKKHFAPEKFFRRCRRQRYGILSIWKVRVIVTYHNVTHPPPKQEQATPLMLSPHAKIAPTDTTMGVGASLFRCTQVVKSDERVVYCEVKTYIWPLNYP